MVKYDILVQENEFLTGINNWKNLLGVASEQSALLEKKNRTGRPFGSDGFLK